MLRSTGSRPTSTILVAVALALIAAGSYLNYRKWFASPSADSSSADAPAGSDAGEQAVRPRTPKPPDLSRRLRIIPEKLDAGTISLCGPGRIVELELANDTKEPLKVMGWAASCACLIPQIEQGFTVEPGASVKVPVRIDAFGIGGKSHRLDFRLEGNSRGGSARIDYSIESPLIPMPILINRPDREDTTVVDIQRVDAEGVSLPEKFRITGIEPPVAKVVDATRDGHVLLEIDFKAIDALADGASPRDTLFDWRTRGAARRWESMQLSIATDCAGCPDLRVRVSNR